MRKLAILLGILVLTSAYGVAADDTPEAAVIENRVLRLEIAGSPVPHVACLVHKPSGRHLIAAADQQSLFSIVVRGKNEGQTTLESAQAGESSAAVEKAGGMTRIRMRYAKFPDSPLSAEVTATSDANGTQTSWSIRIKDIVRQDIKAVRFPQLSAVPTIGEAREDILVLPALPGTLIQNPAENWRDGQRVTLSYPGNLSAQFLAYQGREAGIYLAATDSAGHPMSLNVMKYDKGFRLWHEYVPVAVTGDASDGGPGEDAAWESPYDVAIGVTQGTWYESADQYKLWAVKQPWCLRKLTERDDIPGWWKQGPAVHVVEVRTYNNARTCNGSYYPQLLEHMRRFRQEIGGPVVPMLAGWENHRRWTAGDCFPLFDSVHAGHVLGQLREGGFRPFVYLSGLYYTFRNEGRDGEDIPAAEKYLASYVVDAESGRPRTYELDESSRAGDWKRHSYEFCVAEPQTAEFFCQTIDQLHDLGIDVVQMDQTTSGAGDPCFATSHRHSPGIGLYQSQSFWRLSLIHI